MAIRSALVIPATRSSLVGRALRSALSQTRRFDRIVIVDDGPFIAGERLMNGSNGPLSNPDLAGVKVVRTRGGEGPGRARNMGVEAVRGEADAVCYLDDDDELLRCEECGRLHCSNCRQYDDEGTPYCTDCYDELPAEE